MRLIIPFLDSLNNNKIELNYLFQKKRKKKKRIINYRKKNIIFI